MTVLATTHDVTQSYALVSPEARSAQAQIMVAGPPRLDENPTIVRTVELRERPFAPLIQRLETFETLRQDWDSYGAAPVSACALTTARVLLGDLSLRPTAFGGTTIVPFSVNPVATGGINIEWRRADAALELWINADGGIEAVFDRRRSEPRFEEKTLNSIPAAVAEVLAFAA